MALTVGLGTTAKSAWAGYLTAPTLSSSPSSGAFSFSVNGTTEYATPNSSFGETVPTISALDSVTGSSLVAPTLGDNSATAPILYSASGLDLQLVKTMTSSYSMGSGTVVGNVISNVFAVGSGATMSGAVKGELVFTYQFDVTGSLSNNNGGINSASIGHFNEPNGTMFNLGSGILTTDVGPTFAGGTYSTGPGTTALLTLNNLSSTTLNGSVKFANNNSINALSYQLQTGDIGLGQYTPEFFVASNAYYTSMGTIGFSGSGLNGGAAVFVPGTPEPKTLILFGSGIALLAFMFRRKQESTLSI